METLKTRNIHARRDAVICLVARALDSNNESALALKVQPSLILERNTTRTTVSVGNSGDFHYTFTNNQLESITYGTVKDKHYVSTSVPAGKTGLLKRLYNVAMSQKKL